MAKAYHQLPLQYAFFHQPDSIRVKKMMRYSYFQRQSLDLHTTEEEAISVIGTFHIQKDAAATKYDLCGGAADFSHFSKIKMDPLS